MQLKENSQEYMFINRKLAEENEDEKIETGSVMSQRMSRKVSRTNSRASRMSERHQVS